MTDALGRTNLVALGLELNQPEYNPRADCTSGPIAELGKRPFASRGEAC